MSGRVLPLPRRLLPLASPRLVARIGVILAKPLGNARMTGDLPAFLLVPNGVHVNVGVLDYHLAGGQFHGRRGRRHFLFDFPSRRGRWM